MKGKKVAIYARVSDSQQNPDMQLLELREYASARKWEIVCEYVDHGFSGATQSRPQLNRLVVDAHKRRFDIVLCWRLDRWGRSLKHLVSSIFDLDSYGVAFVSLHDNLDLSTASGRLMFSLLAGMADFERSLIQERVKAGLRAAKLKGKRLGRPSLRRLTSDEIEEICRRRKEDDVPFRTLAKEFGCSVWTVHTLCTRRKLKA